MATNAHMATVAAKVELGIVPSYKDAGVSNKIVKLAVEYRAAADLEKKWKQEKEDLKAEILVEMSKAGLNAKEGESAAIIVNDLKVTAVASHNSNISSEALLASGVPAETIVECTKQTPYEYILVTDTVKAKVARKERKAGVKNIASAKKRRK